jgi:hypothetical protein
MSNHRFLSSLRAIVTSGCLWTASLSNADAPSIGVPVLQAAAQLGITAESLVLADLHGYATTILAQLEADEQSRAYLGTLQGSLNQAQAELAALQQLAAAAGNDATLTTQLQEAQQNVQTIQQQVATARQAFLQTVTQNLPPEGVERLQVWRESAGVTVPESFRIEQLSAEQWKVVEAAIRAEKRAERLDTELDPDLAGLLSDLRADFDVIAAAGRLSNHLSTCQATFAQYELPVPIGQP